jgi:hypothetical protein
MKMLNIMNIQGQQDNLWTDIIISQQDSHWTAKVGGVLMSYATRYSATKRNKVNEKRPLF